MSRLWVKLTALFRNKTFLGMDKSGNQYFTKTEQIDGIMKEKRWVEFKGEHDPTSIPVEWICWLNGQRKRAPTPEEMAELESRRERVRLNVAFLKKEEEERKAKEGKSMNIGKAAGPDLKSFIQQFPVDSEGNKIKEAYDSTDVMSDLILNAIIVVRAPKNHRQRKKSLISSENSQQSLQSQQDLVNPSDLGHGSHEHDK